MAPPPGAAGVEELGAELSGGALSGLRVAPLHGRMPADEKDATMRAFGDGEIDVLVATTVIEVGVDVAVSELFTESLTDADGGAPTYLDMQRANTERITTGLS